MWHLLMLFGMVSSGGALICTRRPANTATPKSPVDENYVISITGNPETYILGQEYNVSLNSFNGHRYISFILALENENGDFSFMNDLGRFDISDTIEQRFSPNCMNMVENTNTNPRTHMHLTWTAPSNPGSGCILIRATVLQHRDVWHMDDGGLTRRICEETVDDVESQPTGLTLSNPCCACDEARYELIFEGVWSRNLHPRNFPARGWETRFCELVGAAHSSDYRFWEAGALASEGVKQYAEHCSSRLLDQEFSINFRDQKIRTIIKARGPAFPNLNSKTMASVRVDPLHHMISFASKIEPSPDWMVGVSGLELCLRNCTWMDTKVINLYPWDVGTDAGPTYTSPDQPQVPPDVIRRIRSDFPNDPRSPFYDEAGEPMKPMATLTVRRQKIYERRCADEDSNNDADVPRECHTHPWNSWSDCSSKCGEGMQYRRRVYKQPELSKIFNCNVELYEEHACEGQICGSGNIGEPMRNDFYMDREQQQQRPMYQQRAECQVSPWSSWNMCSVTCGEGYQQRKRQYLNPGAELKCQGVHQLEMEETRRCLGATCLGNLPREDNDNRYEEQNPYETLSENEGDSDDGGFKPFAFPVGDLKGNQWDQNQDRQTSYKQTSNTQTTYRQPTNIQSSYRDASNSQSSYRQPSNSQTSYRQPSNTPQSYNPPTYQTNKNQGTDYGQMPRLEDAEHAPYQRRPNTNYNLNEERFSNQRQNNQNRDYNDQNPNTETDNISWQRQTNNNNINNNNYNRDYNTNSNLPEVEPYLSKRCFRMLQTNPPCRNETITGNFWFYNFCLNECMLYASDSCDRNVNKFSRFEACEECRRPEFQQFQERAARTEECKAIVAAYRADQQFWREEYGSHSRRRG